MLFSSYGVDEPPNTLFSLMAPFIGFYYEWFLYSYFSPTSNHPRYTWGCSYQPMHIIRHNNTPYFVLRSHLPPFFRGSNIHQPFPWYTFFEPFYSFQVNGDYMCICMDGLAVDFHYEKSQTLRAAMISERDHIEDWILLWNHDGEGLYFSYRLENLGHNPNDVPLTGTFREGKYALNYGPTFWCMLDFCYIFPIQL